MCVGIVASLRSCYPYAIRHTRNFRRSITKQKTLEENIHYNTSVKACLNNGFNYCCILFYTLITILNTLLITMHYVLHNIKIEKYHYFLKIWSGSHITNLIDIIYDIYIIYMKLQCSTFKIATCEFFFQKKLKISKK